MRRGPHTASARTISAHALVIAVFAAWAATLVSVAAHAAFQTRQRAGVVAARVESPTTSLPRPVRLREVRGRGLLFKIWMNGRGPYTFALDTGAGANLLSPHVAAAAGVRQGDGPVVSIRGVSGVGRSIARRARPQTFALGDAANIVPARGLTLVAEGLPPDLDGVLDPAETFSPTVGYVIDFPREELSFFDPRVSPLRREHSGSKEAVVAWLTDGTSRRPYVALEDGRRVLLDTGSNFGLAIPAQAARNERPATIRDLGGGMVAARRVRPSNISVGALALRSVPTDLLPGAASDAPVLLGREALRPFRLSFDPLNRLVRFAAPAR